MCWSCCSAAGWPKTRARKRADPPSMRWWPVSTPSICTNGCTVLVSKRGPPEPSKRSASLPNSKWAHLTSESTPDWTNSCGPRELGKKVSQHVEIIEIYKRRKVRLCVFFLFIFFKGMCRSGLGWDCREGATMMRILQTNCLLWWRTCQWQRLKVCRPKMLMLHLIHKLDHYNKLYL